MEKRIIEIEDEANNKIYIEAEVNPDSLEMVAGGENEILKALTRFEDSLEPVVNLSKAIMQRIEAVNERPKELELSFSIKLSGKLDFWVISGNGEGNIDLKMKWLMA